MSRSWFLILVFAKLASASFSLELFSSLFRGPPQSAQALHDVNERFLQLPDDVVSGMNETTTAPTESPAPSPSPSEIPTAKPSVTRKPTAAPTEPPTESPAPSPSPSSIPTNNPTPLPTDVPSMQPTTTPYPTDYPSAIPSNFPTTTPTDIPSATPSISSQPSPSPSSQPSSQPSTSPTVSSKPSMSPSVSPTLSAAPSAAPTHVALLESNWTFTLELTDILNDTQIEALVIGTEQWMDQLKLSNNGFLSEAKVDVVTQTIIEPTPFDRKLQADDDEEPYTLLQISMAATAMYTGPDIDFDLSQLEGPLQRNDPEWIHLLGNLDPVFLPLRPSNDVAGVDTPFVNDPAVRSGMSKPLYGLLIFAFVVASILGLFASVYTIRMQNQKERGTELVSPNAAKTPIPTFSSEDDGIVEEKENVVEEADGCGLPLGMDTICCSKPEVEKPNKTNKQNIFRAEEGRQSDPPSTEINFGRMSALFDPNEDKSNMSSTYADSRISANPPPAAASYLYSQNRVGNKETISADRAGNSDAVPKDRVGIEETILEDQEMLLTKTAGGTLGATAVDGSNAGQSDYASQAKSFLQNFLGAKPENNDQQNPAAAKQNAPSVIQRTKSYDSVLRRPGLYDVFAPAGPIGIVVDTTKDGPSVHSLKNTSPMLGLISPGDLIVGLDDQDTRSMTAASLTRLMARKSSQKERKITLLTSDAYY